MKRDEKYAAQLRELTAFQKRHHRAPLAEEIVEIARDPQSALHCEFEWDDAAAAQRDRLNVARKILGKFIRVWVVEEPGREPRNEFIPVYVRDTSKGPQEPGYIQTVEVIKQKRTHEVVAHRLQQAFDDLDKYTGLAVEARVEKEYLDILRRIQRLIVKLSGDR